MNKISIVIAVILLFATGAMFAQDEAEETWTTMMAGQRMHHGMMGRGMMGYGMMHGMHGTAMMGMGDHLIMQLCHFGCPGFILEMSDELNLTDDQISDLKSMMNEYQKYATKKMADIRVAKIELSEMLDMSKPDFDNVKEKVDEIAVIEKEMRVNFLDNIEKSRNLLTAEQLK
ncbi:hypothetical protein GF337_18340, partial [candidate division KSB1 bacterium]|nr:hypothetical protein [candidate division KSB1 bacterium]